MRGFVFRSALLHILQAKPQLIEVELLGTRAKPMPQQTLDQQQQLLVLGLQLQATTSRSMRCRTSGSSGSAARSICTSE